MLLSQLKENESALIDNITDGCSFRRRLFDMGFISGQRVECTNIALCGSPIAYSVCGAKIAIRKKDAALIEVVM